MSGDVNRFGLKRRIPPDVSRAVRKRCGFGCVVCGSALYDYDHFSPEFKDAPGHDPLGIILLCPNHHRAKGGFVSRATLERCANAPFCKAQGFSHTAMDIGNLTISIGPYVAYRCRTPLEVNSMFGVDRIGFRGAVLGWLPIVEMPMRAKAIWFEPSEEDGAPLQLNAIICGRDGRPLAWIENNVWHGSASNLDIQVVAGNERSKVRVQAHDDGLVLDVEFVPPNLVTIYKAITYFWRQRIEICGSADGGYIKTNDTLVASGNNIVFHDCGVAASI